MKHKATADFTKEEKEWMDTIATNYILAQSDGFQSGYGQAISDLIDNIIDYWKGSDDEPQESILHLLVDLGEELKSRKNIVRKSIEIAKERGYENYYCWQYQEADMPFAKNVNIFTKREEEN